MLNLTSCVAQAKLFCNPFVMKNKLRDRFLNHSFIFVKVRDRLFIAHLHLNQKGFFLLLKKATFCQLKCLHLYNEGYGLVQKWWQKKFAWKSKLRIICNLMGVLYPPNFFVYKKIAFNKMTPIDLPKVAIFCQILKNLVQIIIGWNPYHFFHEIFAKFHRFFS